MLDHVSITVTDIGAAEEFYDAVEARAMTCTRCRMRYRSELCALPVSAVPSEPIVGDRVGRRRDAAPSNINSCILPDGHRSF